jgi:hypothetical protein
MGHPGFCCRAGENHYFLRVWGLLFLRDSDSRFLTRALRAFGMTEYSRARDLGLRTLSH